MADFNIVMTDFDLSAKLIESMSEFVNEQLFEFPDINKICNVMPGVTYKEQLAFASIESDTGIADTTDDRPESGADFTLSQKYIEPLPVGDTLKYGAKKLAALFRAYYKNIKKYEETYDITGSDVEKFVAIKLLDAAKYALNRLVWFGNSGITAAGTSSSGLADSDDVKFYSCANGLWKRIIAGVSTPDGFGLIPRYAIAKNALTTYVAQALALGATIVDNSDAETIFESVFANADSRLRTDPNRQLLVTNSIFQNYRQSLQRKGVQYQPTMLTDGLPSLDWNGIPVINMDNSWDRITQSKFAKTNASPKVANYLPHLAVLTVPNNLVVGTLEATSMLKLESFYLPEKRQVWMAYGFTLDTLVLENYMISVAY